MLPGDGHLSCQVLIKFAVTHGTDMQDWRDEAELCSMDGQISAAKCPLKHSRGVSTGGKQFIPPNREGKQCQRVVPTRPATHAQSL